jgi:Fe-S cluster assembly iron-binding protein IscA
MALDEPKDTDKVYEIDGFKYVVDKDFLEKARPLKVDFVEYGFKLSSSLQFQPAGSACSGCSSSVPAVSPRGKVLFFENTIA